MAALTVIPLMGILGVSRQTISSWENGKSYPDLVSIIKMSDIFNILIAGHFYNRMFY